MTFSPNSGNIICYSALSTDDQVVETLETFTFSLLSDDPAITGINPSVGQISVLDNDGKRVFL